MFRIADAPWLDQFQRAAALKVAHAVTSRISGLRCSYNARMGGLLFHYTPDPSGGPYQMPRAVWPKAARDASIIDDAVRYINLGKMPATRKERIAKNQKTSEASDARSDLHKTLDDVRPEANSYVGFRDRARRGVQKVTA